MRRTATAIRARSLRPPSSLTVKVKAAVPVNPGAGWNVERPGCGIEERQSPRHLLARRQGIGQARTVDVRPSSVPDTAAPDSVT